MIDYHVELISGEFGVFIGGAIEPISIHRTKREANIAIMRYREADKRRELND